MPECRRPSSRTSWIAAATLLVGVATASLGHAALSAEMAKQLGETQYVYMQSQRKDGSFGAAAEIWFSFRDGVVYVASKKTSWRVRRLQAGRKAVKIHAFMPSGPAFEASGEIVKDPEAWKAFFAALAKKYPDGWASHEKVFREGSADGSYLLIRYTPK